MTPAHPPAHTVLDTDFGDGAQFFTHWRQWRSRPAPRGMLHYVGLQAAPLGVHSLPTDAAQAKEWAKVTHGIGQRDGFFRLLLDGGRISLTLCLGAPRASLTQLALQADLVYLGLAASENHALAALARCCKRGTHIKCTPALRAAHGPNADRMRALGFQPSAAPEWVFDPGWPVLRSRQAPRPHWPEPQRCTVIGAGISGASVARALALRGWRVQVVDAQAHPAAGATGLPAGLVSPVHSADDGPVSQLTRSGCALMHQHAQALLVQRQDWAPSGAWLHAPGPEPFQDDAAARWLPEALWLQSAALVRAWLATPGVAFTGLAPVHRLERHGEDWVCVDESNQELARSPLVVLANALDAARLLGTACPAGVAPKPAPGLAQALARMHPMYGGVSMGASVGLTGLPAQPAQGNGNFLPSVPLGRGPMWLAGAGFDAGPAPDAAAQHRANQARLVRLLPKTADALAPQFEAGEVQLWQGQRCVSHDRLPLVGPVQAAPDASLWISAAMGARGLTLAALCAELLAARIGGEPLPVPARLARLLDAQRLHRRVA